MPWGVIRAWMEVEPLGWEREKNKLVGTNKMNQTLVRGSNIIWSIP